MRRRVICFLHLTAVRVDFLERGCEAFGVTSEERAGCISEILAFA